MNSAAQLLLEKAGELAAEPQAPSPCISVCRMDADSGVCEGCFRTLDEIAAWGMASDAEKRVIWQALVRRAEGS
jgi:predicted Fe-S protein YdhL (DUF1289 family)